MAEGQEKALHILVEDDVAKAILTELLRRIDSTFLSATGICCGGDAETLKSTIQAIKDTGLPVAVVLDADQHSTPKSNIFKLPGTQAPEKEIFGNAAVRDYVLNTYTLNLADFMGGLGDLDHHDWFARLSKRVSQDETVLVGELARIYSASIPEGEAASLIQQLKEASRK